MFPNAIPSSWIVRNVATEGTSIESLLPFQFGIFDKDTHVALSAGNASAKRKVYFAVGSPNQRQFNQGSKPERLYNQNNADVNFRTELVPTNKVDTIRYQEPKRIENPNVYYLGYNGTGICDTLKFECGKTYMFDVEVKGRPVRNIFPGEMREVIELTTGCCDSCTQTSCDVGEDCHKYIDQLVTNFNSGLWVSRFFTASKVMTCATEPEALTRTNFVKYCLTVCDNGDELALSNVQNQYPTYKITVKDRKAPYTTYEVIKTAGLPSAFTQTNVVFVDECGDCPSGYTSAAAGYTYIVEIDGNNAANNLTAVQAVWATATSASLVNFKSGTSTYYVVASAALTNPAAGTDARIVTDLGVRPATCTSSTVTTGWVSCGTCYKVERELCLTVGIDNCDDGANQRAIILAEAEAFYEALDNVVADTIEEGPNDLSGNCVMEITLNQYNNAYLEDDCDTSPNPVFDPLPPFKGSVPKVCPCDGWTVNESTGCPIPPEPSTNCCQCGVKFETKPTTELLDNFAGYDFATYLEKEPVELTVTMRRDDDATRICDYTSPTWLHAKRASFRQLRGDDVIKRIITERMYNKETWVNQVDKHNILFLQREGIKLGVNIDDFYYAIDVYFNEDYVQNTTTSHSNRRNCVTLFVNENDSTTVSSLKQLLASAFPEAELENWV